MLSLLFGFCRPTDKYQYTTSWNFKLFLLEMCVQVLSNISDFYEWRLRSIYLFDGQHVKLHKYGCINKTESNRFKILK